MIQPEYDMTIAEFETVQAQIDAEIEQAKRELERSLQAPDEEPENEESDDTDDDDSGDSAPTVQIVLKELVAIRVLIVDDLIVTKHLKIYELKVIENSDDGDEPDSPPELDVCVYVWADGGECDACSAMAGTILDGPELPGLHPNCDCSAVLMPLSEYKEKFGAPDPKKQEKYKMLKQKEQEYKNKDDTKFEMAYKNLEEAEGEYTDGKDQVNDEPTNMGIKQSTMDKYAAAHPESNMPDDVKDLTKDQAREIYKSQYWDNTKIPQIQNDRIRNAVFDMNVMSGVSCATRTAQIAINNTGGNVAVDGILGKNTLGALNSIPSEKIDDYMDALKDTRMNFLRQTQNWPTAKGGWTTRTKRY